MSLIVLYFLHSTSVLSFYVDVVVTLSIDFVVQKYTTNIVSLYISYNFDVHIFETLAQIGSNKGLSIIFPYA